MDSGMRTEPSGLWAAPDLVSAHTGASGASKKEPSA